MSEQKTAGSIWILGLVSVVAIVGMVAIFGLQKNASSASFADEDFYFDEQGNLLGQASAANSCSDSDGGQNFGVAGSVSGRFKGKLYLKTDACVSDVDLKEFFCGGTSAYSTVTNCAYGCSGNRCDPAPAATCSDGIQNQGEAGVDCGGPCAAGCIIDGCFSNNECASGLCINSTCI